MIVSPGATIASVGAALRRGDVTAAALVDECLATIAERDGALNAFVLVRADEARAEARAADADLARGVDRGPLHGIPISLKDVLDLAGTPTTAASRVRAGHRAAADAAVTSRLRAAGAVVIGKCNLHELAFGTTGEESAFGPTRHPAAPGRTPGGSSSGSAVSVATGMALASVGTDTGGSIRIPASACGVVGLKPAAGEVSAAGVVPLAPSLDHVGPIARSVRDAALVYRVMRDRPPGAAATARAQAVHDEPGADDVNAHAVACAHDANAHAAACAHDANAHAVDEAELVADNHPARLGVPRRYFLKLIDPAVRRTFERAVARLADAGCRIDDADIPHAADAGPVYLHTQLAEASACHARALDTRPEALSEGVRLRLELGRYVLAEDYVRAQRGRQILTREVDAALETRAALLLPSLAVIPPPLGTETMTIEGATATTRALTLRLTQLFDLTGHPAISIPCGAAGGLPAGLQLVGRRDGTERLLALAARCEDALRD